MLMRPDAATTQKEKQQKPKLLLSARSTRKKLMTSQMNSENEPVATSASVFFLAKTLQVTGLHTGDWFESISKFSFFK